LKQRGRSKRLAIPGLVFLSIVVSLLCLSNWGLPENAAQGKIQQADLERVQEQPLEADSAGNEVNLETSEPEEYVVRKGDCLWDIAEAHEVPLDALVEINELDPEKAIHPGQRLLIPSDSSEVSESEIEGILKTALGYRGVRYRYGGMSSRGFDCSGLVARVMQIHGYRLPHNSAALFQQGQPVKRDSLQPGDLVFFKTTRRARISHVGIYLGEGKFIHASSGKGKVRIDTLQSGYYALRYVGARRIVD
jgi:cell wall-associated NlpC family hydrolase